MDLFHAPVIKTPGEASFHGQALVVAAGHGGTFLGAFSGEAQADMAKAQTGIILLFVAEHHRFAVIKGVAASRLGEEGKLAAGLVRKEMLPFLAGAFSRSPADGAVFKDHQGQTAIDNGLAGQSLAHIPHLGEGHFKGQGGALEPLGFQLFQRLGIHDVQPKITPQGKAAFLQEGGMAHIGAHHLADPRLFALAQHRKERRPLAVKHDSGQNSSHLKQLHRFRQPLQNNP